MDYMNEDFIKLVRKAATEEARLHFDPQLNKDAFYACAHCFVSGAQWLNKNVIVIPDEKKSNQ